MARRTNAGATTGSPRPARTSEPATTRTTMVDPAQVVGNQRVPFLARLHLPPDIYRAMYLNDDDSSTVIVNASTRVWYIEK